MPTHLTWSFKTPRRVALEGVGGAIELRDTAGFASARVALAGGREAARGPDLCAARACPSLVEQTP